MCLPGTVETVREQTDAEAPRLTRRTALAGAAGAAFAAAFPARALADDDDGRRRKRFRDLTHVFAAGFPIFGSPPVFNSPTRRTLVNVNPDGFYGQEWTFWEHTGTHMDAPGHFVEGGRFSPEITPQELVVPIVVIDISERAASDPDAVVTVDDLRRFERRHDRIPRHALVAMDSGWADKLGTPAFKGGDAFPDYHFPGFSLDAAAWLVERRNVTAIGVDTISLDPGNSTTFPVHVSFLGSDRYGLEGLNNLDRIPRRGATAYVGLIPWEEGSGGPCRVIASW
jgi:kynurenine formamidase